MVLHAPSQHGSGPPELRSYTLADGLLRTDPPALARQSSVPYQQRHDSQLPARTYGNSIALSPTVLHTQVCSYKQSYTHPQQLPYTSHGADDAGPVHVPPVLVPSQAYPYTSRWAYVTPPYTLTDVPASGFAAQHEHAQAGYASWIYPAGPWSRLQAQDTFYPYPEAPSFPGGCLGPWLLQGQLSSISFPVDVPRVQPQVTVAPGGVVRKPRGPPHKPKQSGHALWVGNLPTTVSLVELKDHFSRDATEDIESLSLIIRSRCAFVNYRTEAACTAAERRFHKSRFNGAVLVCRLRRSSVPTCKHLTASDVTLSVEQPQDRLPATSDQDKPTAGAVTVRQVRANDNIDERRINVPARYFILKSLTILDLQLSVRHGVWVTQRHNEDALNQAFQSTNNVYLFFSANKSGEFFGYARMASRLLEGGVEPSCMGVKVVPNDMQDALDAPKVTMTPATRWAPRGRVVDDSARGTVFWEAGPSTSESAAEAPKAAEPSSTERGASLVAHGQGKPFRIQWISTTRLPFYRTRGLRNPWNANREVKRARDGTELEADVGERLLQLFLHS